MSTQLDKLVESLDIEQNIYIQVHKIPDPDALSSALGIKHLLETRNIHAEIVYKGRASKSVSRMKELLHPINVINLDKEEINPIKSSDNIIYVDCQYGSSNVSNIGGTPTACIDHHQIHKKFNYKFADIRSNVGACATIVYNWFIECNEPLPPNIASALLYGIKIDTLEMTRGVSKLDLEAYSELHKIADLDKMQELQKNSRDFEDVLSFREALRNIYISNRVCYTYMGFNKKNEVMAEISEFLLDLGDIDFVVAFTDVMNGIRFSIRSATPNLNAGEIASEVLETIGNGGGHPHMAGGFAESIHFINLPDTTAKMKFIIDKFDEKIQEKLTNNLILDNKITQVN